jgi:hypothetical protein
MQHHKLVCSHAVALNRLLFMMETRSILHEVWTEFLYKIYVTCFVLRSSFCLTVSIELLLRHLAISVNFVENN